MIFGYTHNCDRGHTYKKLVLFGDKPKCPACAIVERFTERTLKRPEPINPYPERRGYRAKPAPRYSYSRIEPTSTPPDTDARLFFNTAPLGRSYEEKREAFASGGGGDFGGGGATASWEPAAETCSRSSDSSSSYSSDSSSSYSSSDSSSSCDSSSSSSSD